MALLAGCSSRGPVFSRMSADSLFAYATNRLEGRNWDDAAQAFQQFTFQFPSDTRYQEARFRLGEAYFGKREYVTSASEFDRLASDFPSGAYAAEARLKVCDSYARLSPKPPLDPQYTESAIEHCESLIAYHPRSPLVARAHEIIAEMHDKLAEKIYRTGDYYFKIRAYDSAVKYFDDTLTRYPESTIVPMVLFRLWETYTRLGYTEEANTARDRLIRDHPQSAEARRIQAMSGDVGA